MLILNKKGLNRLRKGEVLITPMILPDFVSYIKKVDLKLIFR